MTCRVVRIEPETDPRWHDFVAGHPRARLAHTAAWLAVLQRAYGYQPAHLACEAGGALQGVLPLFLITSPVTGKRLVSLPFSGPAGPLGLTPQATGRLVEAAMAMMADLGCDYLNLQCAGLEPTGALARFAAIQPFVQSVMPLDAGSPAVWRRIPVRTVRQEITRARRCGVTVRLADGLDELEAFYRLSLQVARRHGIPPQPWGLFESMWTVLRPRRMLQLFLAVLDGRVVNAMLCFCCGDTVSAGYVGTDYRFLRHHVVKLTDWMAIEWACRHGYRAFDFLQSHVRNAGLRWYKRSFGAFERPVTYYYFPKIGSTAVLREALIGRRSPVAPVARTLVRCLPGAGLRILGRLVFPHMG